MADAVRWIRTNRRAPGEDRRTPGPWHVLQPGSFSDLSWCGKRPGRVLSAVWVALPAGEVPDGSICVTCLAARSADRPRRFRGR